MGFDTWNLRNVAARRVKSIHEGTQIIIPARKRVGFSVGAVLSQTVDPRKVKAINKMKSEAVSQKRSREGRVARKQHVLFLVHPPTLSPLND